MPNVSRSCSVSGCDRPYRCKGYCNVHYRRWLKTGHAFDDPKPAPVMPGEEWRKVPGWPDYSVSSFGRVRRDAEASSTWSGRILRQGVCKTGYRYVTFVSRPRRKKEKVHKAVALAFLGPRPEGMQINHKDGDKANNRPENLEYVTGLANMRHAEREGLIPRRRGERHWNASLSEGDVRAIRQAAAEGEPAASLAGRFGVGASHICDIVNRRSWRHVE